MCQDLRVPPTILTYFLLASFVATSASEPRFPGPAIPSQRKARDLVSGDFNEDGRLDLVHTGFVLTELDLLIGRGDGSFTKHNLPAEQGRGVRVDDFNQDGHADIAVATRNAINIWSGNGDGSFAGPGVYVGCEHPTYIEVGDFNEDGHDDLAMTSLENCIGVLPGNGDGTFGAALLHGGVNTGGEALGSGDLDADGHLDVVVEGGNTIELYFGQGDGTFRHDIHGDRIVVGSTYTIAVAHLNGNVFADIVVGDFSADAVGVILDLGPVVMYPVTRDLYGNPYDIEIADVDEDGADDLIVGNFFNRTGSVFLGNGDGSFGLETTFPTPYLGGPAVVGDYDGDGRLDVAVVSWHTADLIVVEGNGDGTFGSPHRRDVAAGSYPSDVQIEDLDGDGNPDLATANRGSDDVTVLFGLGRGAFAEPLAFAVGLEPWKLDGGDLDGDGDTDLVSTNLDSLDASVLINLGNRTFAPEARILTGEAPNGISVGRLDQDAFADLVYGREPDTVQIMRGRGDGTFAAGESLFVGMSPLATAIADVNLDGANDVIVGNAGSEDVSLLLGNGDGSFQPEQRVALDAAPQEIAVADVNRDGRPDVVVTVTDNVHAVRILQGAGDGTLAPPYAVETAAPGEEIAVGDLDGDGRVDLAVTSMLATVVPTNGGASFSIPEHFTVLGNATGIGIVDLNEDGWNDLVASHRENGITILDNRGPTVFMFAPDRVNLGWPRVSGATSYDLYRGVLSALRDGTGLGDGFGSCQNHRDPDTSDNNFPDSEVPAAGDGFFYLVAVAGEGIGTTSAGAPRWPTVPCPSL